jgi:heat shock protein HslJ
VLAGLAVFVLSAFVVVARSNQSGGELSESVLGREWAIHSVDGEVLGPDARAWFRIIEGDGGEVFLDPANSTGNVTVEGNDGCNDYTGRAQLTANRLEATGGMTITLMECPDSISVIPWNATFSLESNWLILKGDGGMTVVASSDLLTDGPPPTGA